MRRMNSILLGHHGASGRTDCMYLRIASCVAGSSQESGRCTMRDGTTMIVQIRNAPLARVQRFEQRFAAQAVCVS